MALPPSTPTKAKSRLVLPSTPTSRNGSTTPTGRSPLSRAKSPAASASPQVKAALAALRKSRQQSTSSSSSPADPFSTPPRKAAGAAESNGVHTPGVGRAVARTEEGDEFVLEWGGKSEKQLLEEAKRTGRLQIASRSLSAIPSKVYSTLMPPSSSYHPSNRAPPSSVVTEVDFRIAGPDEEEEEQTAWYEQQDLRALVAANNEIEVLEEEIGGFEELQTLDIRNNYLGSLPISLAYLTNLTTLNLSSNKLIHFPTQLLNLTALRELNLASNALTSLWTPDWRVHLGDSLRPPNASPSATPESPEQGRGFWESFPSSPTKKSNGGPPAAGSTAPFPNLTSLALADNPLAQDSLTQEGFELPPRLTVLDLSDTGLRETSLPLRVLGRLRELVTLDLAGCAVGDGLFADAGDLLGQQESRRSTPPPTSNPFRSASPPPQQQPPVFPSLRTLSLARNSIDTLATLESFLLAHVRRPFAYVGLDKPIDNLIHAEAVLRKEKGQKLPWELDGEPKDELKLDVRDNMMRNERERRRARFPRSGESPTRTPSPPPVVVFHDMHSGEETEAAREMEQWEIAAASGLATEGGRRRARAELARREREAAELGAGVARLDLGQEEEEASTTLPEQLESPLPVPAEAVDAPPASNGNAGAPNDSPPSSPPAADDASSPSSTPSGLVVSAPPSPPPTASPDDPAVVLIQSNLNSSSGALKLASRSLSSLSTPTTGAPPPSFREVTSADLSLNAFPSLPLAALATWTWTTSLVHLNLSRNKISSVELGELEVGGLFPSLRTLDLSWNALESRVSLLSSATTSTTSTPILSLLATLVPSLETLNLEHNRLTTLEGIAELVLASGESGKGGVKQLRLRGNKIADVEDLCEVARGLESEGVGGERREKGRWKCEMLDLAENELSRLPPTLGLLPHSLELHLLGNRFRIPRQDVYENAQLKLVLPWLKDRL